MTHLISENEDEFYYFSFLRVPASVSVEHIQYRTIFCEAGNEFTDYKLQAEPFQE